MKNFLLNAPRVALLAVALAGCSTFSSSGGSGSSTSAPAAEVKPEIAEQLKALRAEADKGNPAAQTRLGLVYARGKASDQGFPPAQTNLAVAYLTGQGGVTQDPAEAARLTRAAADKGWPPAMTQLGFMYGKGVGVRQDWKEAERWLKLAADKNDDNAKRLLAELKQMRAQQGGGAPAPAAPPKKK